MPLFNLWPFGPPGAKARSVGSSKVVGEPRVVVMLNSELIEAALPPGWLDEIAEGSLALRCPSREQALAVLRSDDSELLDVVAAAARVRRAFFANRVKLNYLVNMKSGLCGEDCSYCSQRRGSESGVLTYNWVKPADAAAEAERAVARGAKRVCLVASGRGPTDRDLARVAETVRVIKERHPDVEICTSLGLLTKERAEHLLEAGVYAYNHNLNTSEANYADISSTHTYADGIDTVGVAHDVGLSPCSGAIFGMGEHDEDIV